MKHTEKISLLKRITNELFNDEKEKIETIKEKFYMSGDKKLVIEGESAVEGAVVTIDGKPAPDGDYKVDEIKATLTISGGKITSIKKEEEVAASATPIAITPSTAPVAMSKEKETELVEEIKKLKLENENFSKEFKALSEKFEALIKKPAAEPIKTLKSEVFSNEDNEENLTMVQRILRNK